MTREEVVASLGVDTDALEKGLGVGRNYMNEWITDIKTGEQKYSEWWKLELKKREESEVTSSVESASRSIKARRLLQERETLRQAAMNKTIGAGSIPANMAGGMAKQAESEFGHVVGGVETVAGGYVFSKATGKLVGKLGQAESAVGEVAKHSRGMSTAMREFVTIIREASRGNFSRIPGSASILMQSLGAGMSFVPVIGAAAAGIWGNLKMRKALNEMNADGGMSKEQRQMLYGQGKELNKYIAQLEKFGKLTADQVKMLSAFMAGGHITTAQNKLRELFPGGMSIEQARSDFEKQKAEQKEEDRRRKAMAENLAKLNREELEAKKRMVELAASEARIREMAAQEIKQVQHHEYEKFMPTLDELSHSRFGSTATGVRRLDRRIKREFLRGDVAGAQKDIGARDKLYDSLVSKGVIAERSESREIRDINARMQIRLEKMGTEQQPLVMKWGQAVFKP